MTSSNFFVQAKHSLQPERGLRGLINIGNTCFLNSVIQCLSNTKPLLEYVLNQEYVNEINNQSRCLVIKRFADLIHNIWEDQRGPLSTQPLKNAVVLYAPRFHGSNQEDAQEFLRILLEGLHEEINRARQPTRKMTGQLQIEDQLKAEETWRRYLKSDNSKVVDTFGGMLRSILKCTSCGFSSIIFEPFWDISLPIPSDTGPLQFQQLHLRDCLDFFTKEETLDGNERPICSKCKTRQACIKRIAIQRFPQVLVIHLKRFSSNGMAHKIDRSVDFPVIGLNLAPYSAEAQLRNMVYNLYGVVSHFGTCQYGHYTAFCKQPYSGEWHRFNDKAVSVVNPEVTDKSSAYILFYEQKF